MLSDNPAIGVAAAYARCALLPQLNNTAAAAATATIAQLLQQLLKRQHTMHGESKAVHYSIHSPASS
jgi:hypothetical protein